MYQRIAAMIVLLFCYTIRIDAEPGPNLAPNPGFEQGDENPDGWQVPDNLTVYWDDNGITGKCLRLNSGVSNKVWKESKSDLEAARRKHRSRKEPVRALGTVGAGAGVAVYSRPIPVEEDAHYLIQYDIKGPGGEPFVFIKGFWRCEEADLARIGTKRLFQPFPPDGPRFSLMQTGTSGGERLKPTAGDYIQCFRRRCITRLGTKEAKNQWRRYTGVVHLKRRYHVEAVMLELYAFMPPGEFRFDNINFRRVTEQEAEKILEQKKARGKSANYGSPVRAPR